MREHLILIVKIYIVIIELIIMLPFIIAGFLYQNIKLGFDGGRKLSDELDNNILYSVKHLKPEEK